MILHPYAEVCCCKRQTKATCRFILSSMHAVVLQKPQSQAQLVLYKHNIYHQVNQTCKSLSLMSRAALRHHSRPSSAFQAT